MAMDDTRERATLAKELLLVRVNALIRGGNVIRPSRGEMGSTVGALNTILGGDENRRIAVGWLLSAKDGEFAPLSSKALSPSQARALYEWVGSWKDSDDRWRVRNGLHADAYAVLTCALEDYNKLKLSKKAEIGKPDDSVLVAVGDLGGVITKIDGSDIPEQDNPAKVPEDNPLE